MTGMTGRCCVRSLSRRTPGFVLGRHHGAMVAKAPGPAAFGAAFQRMAADAAAADVR